MDEKGGPEQYWKDVKDLPLWLKYIGAACGILAVPGAIFSAWVGYQTFKITVLETPTVATTTINVSTIFSRYEDIDRSIDQQNFLQPYKDTSVVGSISYADLGKSQGSNNQYHLYGTVSTGLLSSTPVICEFRDAEEETERRLNLLRKGDEVVFVGTFTGSVANGWGWYVQDCSLL